MFTDAEVRELMSIMDERLGAVDHAINPAIGLAKTALGSPEDRKAIVSLRASAYLVDKNNEVIEKLLSSEQYYGHKIPGYFVRYYIHCIQIIEQHKGSTSSIEWLDRKRQTVHKLILLYAGEEKGGSWDKWLQKFVEDVMAKPEG